MASDKDKKRWAEYSRAYRTKHRERISDYNNEWFKKKYSENKEPFLVNQRPRQREQKKRQRGELHTSYVTQLLKESGLDQHTISENPEIVDIQAKIILTKRLLKQ